MENNVEVATRVLHERVTDSRNTRWISAMPQAKRDEWSALD